MASKRLAVFDPSGRLLSELSALAVGARVTLVSCTKDTIPTNVAAVLVAPLVASDLGPAPADGPPRWIVGDGANAARVAGAAAQAGASGVLLSPVSESSLDAIAHADPLSPDVDLARARGLIATSLIDLTGAANETLSAVAEGFAANDCIVWWRDGSQMTPTAARPFPTEDYRTQIAGAARIAAAASGTVITSGPNPRSVIADALRSGRAEVAGLVALVSDSGRRFSASERTDLKAIAARLTRELSWLTSHRRLVQEGERLMAASLHDPLTGAMTRGAFEQTIAHEVAAAQRRNERLTLVVFDIAGLRRINLQHGHKAGDEALAQTANRIRAMVRGNDPIGRLGGDEIAVLLVGASDEQAALVVRKILHKTQTETIKVDGDEIRVQIRAIASEIGAGERSGEAAFARCYAVLRSAPIGDVRIVASDERTSDSDHSPDSGSLSTGTVVGGTYRVVHELSRGAMGVVYRGEDLGLGRQVAIKVLRSDLASDRDLVSRFRAEAGILASLHHPNLVQVYALGEHAGEVYFVMELVEGQPLSEVLRSQLEKKEWFPIAAIAQITIEISDALDAMHALGVIHRDVKPANILLDREKDRAVLVDVGVAVKAGDQRDAAGTPGFAAPESFLEHTDGPMTDVYGLAATVYCMLTGRPPFGSGPAPQVVQRQLHDALTPPSQLRPNLSEAVDDVLAKALNPATRKRWASASTFAVALGRALERLPVDPAPVPTTADDAVKQAEAIMAPTAGLDAKDIAHMSERGFEVVPVERTVVGQVRAAHLRVLTKLLQHHVGESGMARVINEFPALAQAFSSTLAPLAWIELADLIAAMERARELIPNQPIARKIGRGTMSATFARMFGADPTTVPAETVVAALPSFWDRYHAWGAIDVQVETGLAQVSLAGYSGSVEVCALVAAELERIVELTGAAAVGAAHVQCVCNGDARCEFRLSWTPAT